MTQTTETVRRTASISREDALKGLLAKFPGFDIVSFKQEGNEFVAEITKQGFDEAALLDAAPVTSEEDPDAEAGPPADEGDDADVKVEVDGGDDDDKGASEKDLLQELVDLVREMVGGDDPAGEGAPHGEEGPMGPPEAVPGDPGISGLPARVSPTNSMEGMSAAPTKAFAHMAGKRHFFVQAEAPGQSLKSAVAELNRELAPTHRVAKIVRQGSKIVAAVTKVA